MNPKKRRPGRGQRSGPSGFNDLAGWLIKPSCSKLPSFVQVSASAPPWWLRPSLKAGTPQSHGRGARR